ncbi:MAG: dihydroneopterin aldolase [Sphingobacteriales bacterium]|nr:MAG: dihydroneopterin aldolase [Sphingobacteriales bacterium]
MLTVSLHGIRINAPIGLYPDEKIHGNDFETDVDVYIRVLPADTLPFIDYSIISRIVQDAFLTEGELLETFVLLIHKNLQQQFPHHERIRVAIRKMNPPIGVPAACSQVALEY